MIMTKETFKRFGYWPSKDGRGQSRKSIVVVCESCNRQRVLGQRSNFKGGFCKECTATKNAKLGSIARMKENEDKANDYANNLRISPGEWKKMFQSWGTINKKSRGRGLRVHKNGVPTLIPTWKSLAYLKVLQGNFQNIPRTKKQFNDILLSFLHKQPAAYKLAVASEIYKSHVNHGAIGQTNLSLEPNFWSKAMEVLGVNVHCHKTTMKIVKASFFIDGRWVHIG